MSLLDILFREKGDSLSLSGYSLTGGARCGEKYGFIHHDKRAIEIATVRKIQELAANYTLQITDSGTLFIASAAVVVTLPAASAALKGVWAELFAIVDEDVGFATATVDAMITHNDIAADSSTLATTGEQIGSGLRAICTGTKWLVHPILGAEAVSVTVAT